ncbi:MAG: LacI family DNA-binding transcriptional regulator [Alphaproteobacteria bacterium]|nr:LacI family DNA-binding transcriptional regulator [Alphaproteobacteria bacterium]MDE2110089.1 LacI family DNA-binding transcriptional regulator [Alphaproteobacteria bacterium]MDE2495115.1 LacI family DNA-binding transcriptional regulator [Alphaproteobacteria bacterium]
MAERERNAPGQVGILRPTSFDIARKAGVSQPTVSRALRGDPTISDITRRRIAFIAKELGYKVDKNASNLRGRHAQTIAVLFFEDHSSAVSLINPFFLSMLGSISQSCSARGYDLLISLQHTSSNWRTDYEDTRKADGIILLGYDDFLAYRTQLEQMAELGTKFVHYGAALDGHPGPSVGCDDYQSGLMATRHLLALGRRRIAFLGYASPRYPEFGGRYRGYADALREAGLEVPVELQADAVSSIGSGEKAAREVIAGGGKFDAIFAASDLIAIGALTVLKEHGVAVPGDVSVVGFDDIPAASIVAPQLTTVMQDTRLAGETLVDTLIKLMRDESADDTLLPTRLIVRESCGARPAK